jgi:hypothetical protein
MFKKTALLLIALILILLLSACQFGASENEYEAGDPIKQPLNPEVQPTPTPEPSPAMLANSGTHTYSVTATENTCALTLGSPEKNMNIEFKGTTAEITDLEMEVTEVYGHSRDDRYSRISDSFKTIVIYFSTDGYELQIYESEAYPDEDEPCGYFTFTLID